MDKKEFIEQMAVLCESKDFCFVCGCTLEQAHYEPKNSDGTGIIANGITYELKRCSRCGLLYAK